jgi:hypothetical protein
MKEHMVSRPRHEPSKTLPKLDLDSKAIPTNVSPLMCLDETARRRQGPNGLGEDVDPDASTMSYIAPSKPKA